MSDTTQQASLPDRVTDAIVSAVIREVAAWLWEENLIDSHAKERLEQEAGNE